jgi:hypothetical protein
LWVAWALLLIVASVALRGAIAWVTFGVGMLIGGHGLPARRPTRARPHAPRLTRGPSHPLKQTGNVAALSLRSKEAVWREGTR